MRGVHQSLRILTQLAAVRRAGRLRIVTTGSIEYKSTSGIQGAGRRYDDSWRLDISQSLWGTVIALVAFLYIRNNSMRSVGIVRCPHDGSSEGPQAA